MVFLWFSYRFPMVPIYSNIIVPIHFQHSDLRFLTDFPEKWILQPPIVPHMPQPAHTEKNSPAFSIFHLGISIVNYGNMHVYIYIYG